MARLTRVTSAPSGLPHGEAEADRLTDGVAKLSELEEEIDGKIDALIDLRRKINGYIDAIPAEDLQRLLRLRYIDGMKWERIAVEMGIEVRWVYRLHGRALSKLTIESHV